MKNQFAVLAAAIATTFVAANNLSAQATEPQPSTEQTSRWSLNGLNGKLEPTGAQRDAIARGNISVAQMTFAARPTVAFTSTFGWARSKDIVAAGTPKLDVFTYDAGAELRAPRSMTGKTFAFTPFAGVGAGGRSYNYRSLDVDATHNLAAYGSVGGDVAVKRVRVRLEARDYVTNYKPLAGVGASNTRNDIVWTVGVRLVSR